jgi:hypothetical protein
MTLLLFRVAPFSSNHRQVPVNRARPDLSSLHVTLPQRALEIKCFVGRPRTRRLNLDPALVNAWSEKLPHDLCRSAPLSQRPEVNRPARVSSQAATEPSVPPTACKRGSWVIPPVCVDMPWSRIDATQQAQLVYIPCAGRRMPDVRRLSVCAIYSKLDVFKVVHLVLSLAITIIAIIIILKMSRRCCRSMRMHIATRYAFSRGSSLSPHEAATICVLSFHLLRSGLR